MVAWTYNSGEAADVAYTDASVVACHAYSVLGWLRRNEFVDQFKLTDFIPHMCRSTGRSRLDPFRPGPSSFRRILVGVDESRVRRRLVDAEGSR